MAFKAIGQDIAFDADRCKLCDLCVEVCPKHCLVHEDHQIKETGGCIRCHLCAKICPDFAIYVIEDKTKKGKSGF